MQTKTTSSPNMNKAELKRHIDRFFDASDRRHDVQYRFYMDTLDKFVKERPSDPQQFGSIMMIIYAHGGEPNSQTIESYIRSIVSRYYSDPNIIADIDRYIRTIGFASQVSKAKYAYGYPPCPALNRNSRDSIMKIIQTQLFYFMEYAHINRNMSKRFFTLIRLYLRSMMNKYKISHGETENSEPYKEYEFNIHSNNKGFTLKGSNDGTWDVIIPYYTKNNGEFGKKEPFGLLTAQYDNEIEELLNEIKDPVKELIFTEVMMRIRGKKECTIGDIALLGWALNKQMSLIDDSCNFFRFIGRKQTLTDEQLEQERLGLMYYTPDMPDFSVVVDNSKSTTNDSLSVSQSRDNKISRERGELAEVTFGTPKFAIGKYSRKIAAKPTKRIPPKRINSQNYATKRKSNLTKKIMKQSHADRQTRINLTRRTRLLNM